MNEQLPQLLQNKTVRIGLRVFGVILGFGLGAFLVFQILFLYRVIPHGGLW